MRFKSTLLPVLVTISLMVLALPAAADVIDVTQAGAIGDGTTLNTSAIQKTIDKCSAAGGGTVYFPEGQYVIGTIQIKSNVTLELDEKATLLGSTDIDNYRNLDPFIDGSGNPMGYALIVGVDVEHVGITGKGTIDGRGRELKRKQNPYVKRPFLVRWVRCRDVTMRGVTLVRPGAWTLNYAQTQGAVIEDLTIRTKNQKLANNDGINIDSSQDVVVRNCDVSSGDDALVIKATSSKPSHDIQASGCKLSSHTNAIKLGTESYGGFSDISISNCQITNTDMAGIALYEVDGADLRDVTISDVTMDGVTVPISIRLGARLKTFRQGDTPKPEAGHLRDVTIKNVNAKGVKLIGMLINGIPGHPIEDLTLENIKLELPGGGTAEAAKVQLPEKESAYPEYNMFGRTFPAYGLYMRHVRDVTLKNVKMNSLKPDARPAKVLIDVEDVN